MVVGFGTYSDTNEAFPLDSKTLNKIAIRSFFASASTNGETKDSIGWAWAMEPGLKKIHANEEDYQLAMGQNLEFVDAGFYLNTFAMGVMLAMESQKADFATIRSVRTSVCALSKGIGNCLFFSVFMPLLCAGCAVLGNEGNALGALLYGFVLIAFSLVLRFTMLKYGYKKGIQAAEKLSMQSTAIKKACSLAGIMAIGILLMYYSSVISFSLEIAISDSTLDFTSLLNDVFPGLMLVVTFGISYYLLSKKNWSIGKCFILILIFSLVGAFFGIWSETYTTPVSWPWLS